MNLKQKIEEWKSLTRRFNMELHEASDIMQALAEAIEVIETTVNDFENIKNMQHEKLDKGLVEACKNWNVATNVSIDFTKAKDWLKRWCE